MTRRIALTLTLIAFFVFSLCGCQSTNSDSNEKTSLADTPRKPGTEAFQVFLENPIAHRGLYDNKKGIPENSLAAFDEAAKAGYPIELDIQLTSDGKLAVFHDANMSRMANRDWKIAEHKLSEIQEVKLLDSDESIPSFDEVLKCVDGRVPILIEIKITDKTDSSRKEIVKVLYAALDGYKGDVAIQSFDFDVAEMAIGHEPNIPVGLICSEKKTQADVARGAGFDFMGINIGGLSADTISICHRRGQAVLTWTVRNAETQVQVLDRGADNVVFEGYSPDNS